LIFQWVWIVFEFDFVVPVIAGTCLLMGLAVRLCRTNFTWILVHVDRRNKGFPQLGRTGDVGGLPTGTQISDDVFLPYGINEMTR
jgi:hypothetical protein